MDGRARIDKAMVLAAGLGKRMRPITESLPKPLVRVAGRPLIDYAFDALRKAGVDHAVVNMHYLAEQIAAHLEDRTDPLVTLSDESAELLDSGGGIVKALGHFHGRPFFVLNADTFWLESEGAPDTLTRMAQCFDPDAMDMLMLVARPANATGHEARGDFLMDEQGRLTRHRDSDAARVIYAGALVLHPRIFDDAPAGPFSLNRCFDAALASDRLRGLELDGHWLTVGTPEAIGAAEAVVEDFRSPRARLA